MSPGNMYGTMSFMTPTYNNLMPNLDQEYGIDEIAEKAKSLIIRRPKEIGS